MRSPPDGGDAQLRALAQQFFNQMAGLQIP
jgi:hypothetical protein